MTILMATLASGTLVIAADTPVTTQAQEAQATESENQDSEAETQASETGAQDSKKGMKTSKKGSQVSETGTIEGKAVYSLKRGTANKEELTLQATGEDYSGIKVADNGNLTVTDSIIELVSESSNTSESDFFGLNAGVWATSKGQITMRQCRISTDGDGANAVFATGEGSKIIVENTTITTNCNSSRGLDATYGGTVIANNVDISTKGDHCAALATDRGEGTIKVTGGKMKTEGDGSPCIYSTGEISVVGAKMQATGSQAAVIEGKNSIHLTNTTLEGAGRAGVMLYQSFSGDAGVGTSSFNMTGGKLTATVGPIFAINNTDAVINLNTAKLVGDDVLIQAGADRWGKEGENGGHVTLNATSQVLEGNVICDEISSVALNLKEGSHLTGHINADHKAQSIGLSLDKTSTWTVTASSFLSVISDEDESFSNIEDNGYTIYYDGDQNAWLGGKVIDLKDGGQLRPMEK